MLTSGPQLESMNEIWLKKHRITHIMNVTAEYVQRFVADQSVVDVRVCFSTTMYFPDAFTYVRIPVNDKPKAALYQWFASATRYIERVREEKGRILVHCSVGRSRSVSVVLAYLVRFHEVSLAAALKLVQRCRKIALPNPGFLTQLEMWEIWYSDATTLKKIPEWRRRKWKRIYPGIEGLEERATEDRQKLKSSGCCLS